MVEQHRQLEKTQAQNPEQKEKPWRGRKLRGEEPGCSGLMPLVDK
jgi:hypothetical protein